MRMSRRLKQRNKNKPIKKEKRMKEEAEVFRLAKPKRKGILALIFSRFFIIILLLLLELAVMVVPFVMLENYMHHFYGALIIFTLIIMIYLFNSKMDSTAKLTWMLIITAFQVAGALMLLFTQRNTGHRMIKERSERMIAFTKDAIKQDPQTLAKLREEDIFMEYFIIEEGYMWGKILEILVAKAKEGVDVRVMYDGMCEISTLPSNYCKLLEAEGIKAKSFAPITPFISSHYNYRDHRKICVIDGKVAFNGGVNLADEYINKTERFGHWKDTAVMLKGDAVCSFTLMFLQMWNITNETPKFDEARVPYTPDSSAGINPSGYVIPFCDCPLDEDKVGEAVYMDILNRAGNYVHVMTPYLILDGEMETALKYAGQRGIDVKLILPGIPDKKIAYSLAKTHYNSLLEAGVKIYEYTPGFVHAKVWTCDDEKGVVGTINLDYRSLYHHFECATYMYRTDCIADIEKDFQETLKQCRQVTEETIRGTKTFYKIAGPIAKLIAPLM